MMRVFGAEMICIRTKLICIRMKTVSFETGMVRIVSVMGFNEPSTLDEEAVLVVTMKVYRAIR